LTNTWPPAPLAATIVSPEIATSPPTKPIEPVRLAVSVASVQPPGG
jgi:hypothetical protein